MTLTTIDPLTLPSIPLSDRRNLPESAGIYFAIAADGSIQYIGRAKNFRARWGSHHRLKKLAEIESVKIAWLEVSDLLLLPEIESLLIAHFQPPFNKEYEVRFKPSGLTAASLPCATSFRKFTPTGWRLRALMAEKRITNQQLADRLQEITGKPRHRQTITRWRNADTMPLLDGKDLDALQQILECSRDDLLGD